ncbi:uncharacterized protein HKW66_Vig0048350 [Vigna angularis]|uniref:Ribosomal RNA-processing protein 42 n=1 Tax=Phaseolus angularis TaxID=3914 RepID=A0A8T0KYY0_PHAAN|nr:uncharacterized protein HKW66_Vig0048350 [Vigna angularis]
MEDVNEHYNNDWKWAMGTLSSNLFFDKLTAWQANGSARVRMGATDVIASIKGRGGDELAAELSNALQDCLLGGKSGAGAGVDLSSLIVVEGKICWDLYIDGLVVSSDGNLLDALGAAIKIGRHYIVDATSEEESQMNSAVSISVRQGHICGITKRGGVGLDPSIILDMISVAKHVSEQLMNKLDSEIASAEAEDES